MTRRDWINAYESACLAIDAMDTLNASTMDRNELRPDMQAAYAALGRLRSEAWDGLNNTAKWES